MAVTKAKVSAFAALMESGASANYPKVGDAVKGKVVSASRREVRIDIDGITTGVIRGRELFAEAAAYSDINPGDDVEATVIEMENENGELELSFRFAGQKKAWEELRALFVSGDVIEAKVLEANKGGLIVRVGHVNGFLPVSQLAPDNYPRVTGGDKNRILEKLKSLVGMSMSVRVIDVNEGDEKLIVSEKQVWEERQKNVIAQYKVGDTIEGEVTALADFGAFVKFEALEGLVHISEIAWQRIDHPRDLLKLGQRVKAEIIGLEGSKIFLSMKKLIRDPWQDVGTKYKIGSEVEGTVLKVNPFGFFVELDPEIHGLAHVSELSDKPVADLATLGKAGDVKKFRIISIEPAEHRLGLSLRSAPTVAAAATKPAKAKAKKGEETKEEVKEEAAAE